MTGGDAAKLGVLFVGVAAIGYFLYRATSMPSDVTKALVEAQKRSTLEQVAGGLEASAQLLAPFWRTMFGDAEPSPASASRPFDPEDIPEGR